jgi:hypothetical protein
MVSVNEDVHNEQTRIIIISSAALKVIIGKLIVTTHQQLPFKFNGYSPLQDIVRKFATTSILACGVHMASQTVVRY